MDVRQLEELLQSNGLPIVVRHEDGQVGTNFLGRHGACYQINFGIVNGEAGTAALFRSLQPSSDDLKRMQAFIGSDSPRVTVMFRDEQPQGIRLHSVFDSKQFWEEMERFVAACDIAYAASLHISHDAGIDDNFLRLARCGSAELARA